MDDKKSHFGGMLFTIITGIVVLCTIAAFTYAFFTGNIINNVNLNIIANIGEFQSVFTAQTTGNLYLEVIGADMLETGANANNNTVAARASQSISVVFIGVDDSCTYDILWTDTSVTPYVPSNGVTDNSLLEYTIKITDNENNEVLAETQINSFTSGNAIVSGETIASSGAEVSKTYLVTATVYNLYLPQSINGKTYTGMVNVANVVC